MSNPNSLSEDERRALVRRAVDLAQEHFSKQTFNCAESALYGVAKALDLATSDDLFRAATPFGAGLGRAGATCGALSGAAMAVGLRFGRTTPDAEQKEAAYSHVERLWRRFVERAGGEDCRVINALGFQHPDHKAFCARFVALAAELAAEELLGL